MFILGLVFTQSPNKNDLGKDTKLESLDTSSPIL